jgi:hypothetical protein
MCPGLVRSKFAAKERTRHARDSTYCRNRLTSATGGRLCQPPVGDVSARMPEASTFPPFPSVHRNFPRWGMRTHTYLSIQFWLRLHAGSPPAYHLCGNSTKRVPTQDVKWASRSLPRCCDSAHCLLLSFVRSRVTLWIDSEDIVLVHFIAILVMHSFKAQSRLNSTP